MMTKCKVRNNLRNFWVKKKILYKRSKILKKCYHQRLIINLTDKAMLNQIDLRL